MKINLIGGKLKMAFENMGTQVDDGHEMDWDSTINKESEFILAPSGDYDFVVESLTRSRFAGSDKLSPCYMAELRLRIKLADGNTTSVIHRLYLHTKTEGLLSAFFVGIGQKKHGQPLKMDWSKVVGATGRCKIGSREYNGKIYNEVSKIYDPADSQAAPAANGATTPKWQAGSF